MTIESYQDRIGCAQLRERVTSAAAAASLIRDGMTVGMSGFTRAGDVKLVPAALAECAARRMPFQLAPVLRAAINRGEVMYIDQHLSETVEVLRAGHMKPVDIAVIEAVRILDSGAIVPTTSVGNSASFAILADKVIVETNLA